MNSDVVRLNLRGKIFLTERCKFKAFPDSLLANLSTKERYYDINKKEYFFDRNPVLFHFILDAYEDGELHMKKNICSAAINRELRFWMLDKKIIGKCCLRTYYQDSDDIRIHKEYKEYLGSEKHSPNTRIHSVEASMDDTDYIGNREKIWKMVSDPNSSTFAKVYYALVVMTVLCSILIFTVSTVDTFRQPRATDVKVSGNLTSTNSKIAMYLTTRQHRALATLDCISNTVLAIDYVLVIYCSPNRVKAMKSWYNTVDLLVLLFVYAFNILDQTDNTILMNQSQLVVLATFIAAIYSFRILRVLRLMNHTTGMIALYMTFLSNCHVLFYFFTAFVSVSLFSATVLYHAELWQSDSFNNIYQSIWWAVVTLSTVGYGDMVPQSVFGQILAAVVIIYGLLIIAIPFVIITGNYGSYYSIYEFIKEHDKEEEGKKEIDNENGNS